MGKTINLPDEVYTRLKEKAKVQGLTISQLIDQFEKEIEQTRLSLAIERLQAQGLLMSPESEGEDIVSADIQPVLIRGRPLSEIIVEERR